ncbi:MAG: single-stranded-DNA-specific exonuclease RecJ [Phycisphaerae bacterium]|nr:single-stranded-DNA-specific exonuclease RecJ [Phycisphaerae bacterium]
MARRAWRRNHRRWQVAPEYAGAADLAKHIRSAPLVAQVLHNRGLDDPDAAKAFLQPKLTDLHDPLELPGCAAAARRIARAVERKEPIAVYGDYDVDGMTSIAILHACLKLVNCPVTAYVPHRLDEGYGVNVEALRSLMSDGAKLIVTVDCGVCAGEVFAEAGDGAEFIVTDHHALPERLPDVAAVVHPHLQSDGKTYPNPNLCGAGVAFKLAWQVARELCGETRVDETMREFLLEATCLAALGTIADVVPLVGENRTLATFGLRGLPAVKHVGLRALLESAKLTDTSLDAFHIGFVLAPRLNAAGRMGHAAQAVELLTTTDAARADEIAAWLASQNTERQKVERAIAEEARGMVVEAGLDGDSKRAIVLANENWHGGVIGIVASRLVDCFHRPTILIAVNGDGVGQGSGRSIPGFDIAEALCACDEHLLSHGGHAMAGGLKVLPAKIDAFAEAFGAYASDRIAPEQMIPALRVDAETTISSLGYNVVDLLEKMAPFGAGNPRPVIALRGCKLTCPPKRMGRTGQTVGMLLSQNGNTLRAVGFNMGDLADHLVGQETLDIAAEPMLNSFNGRTNVELRLRDVIWE